MKQVLILSGVSGSGKSREADRIVSRAMGDAVKVSADNYFEQNGEYKFDPSKLGAAHAQCFRNFIEAMRGGYEQVIIDNTNTTVEEIAPYILGAEAFDYRSTIITMVVEGDDELEKCRVRNLHKVPASVLMAQQDRLLARKLPRRWSQDTMRASGFS